MNKFNVGDEIYYWHGKEYKIKKSKIIDIDKAEINGELFYYALLDAGFAEKITDCYASYELCDLNSIVRMRTELDIKIKTMKDVVTDLEWKILQFEAMKDLYDDN